MIGAHGVRIVGAGSSVPDKILSNHDLEKMMDTSHDWIVQRTGIHRRHIVDPSKGEGQLELATEAMRAAMNDAGMQGSDLDLIIHGSVTAEMTCPSNACRISHALDAAPAGAFDIVAACSGFVYGLNLAESLVRTGRYRTVGVVGCDAMSTVLDYTERTVSILFGDAAGAVVLTRDDDPDRGCMYQTLHADGSMWGSLYMPRRSEEIAPGDENTAIRLGCLRMNGREIYKFAVTKFRQVIEEALRETNLTPDDVRHFVCHQSNVRILESAKERLGLPDEKVPSNIHEYGNTSAGSVGLLFDELWKAGKVDEGDIIVFVAFGGGTTWGTSVWRV